MLKATEKVSQQNLDFEIGHSKIKEFEDIFLAFEKMRNNLKICLEQKWKED